MTSSGHSPFLRTRRALYALVVGLYVLAFPYHPGLRSPNELCRLWQTRALVEYGVIDLNQARQDYGPVGDLSFKDGKFYPSKAPLLSFAAVPLYKVLSLWGGGFRLAVPDVPLVFWSRLFLTVLPTLLCLVFLRRFLRTYLSAVVTDAVVVTYALGSLAFSYSLLFMSHQTDAVLLFGCFYALWRTTQGRWREWGYAVAGAFAGATVAAEYTGALGLVGLVCYAMYARLSVPGQSMRERTLGLTRALGLATLGALPFVGALAAYHQAAFGHPLHSGYKYLADAGYQPWHLGGFLGIRYPDPRAFALSFFSPLRGFFALAPFLALALPGLVFLWRRPGERALFWLTAVLLVGYAYFTSAFSYESWGWTTGPRHMTGLVPFLLLPVGLTVERLRASLTGTARALLGLAAGLFAASIVITGALTMVNYVPDDVSAAFYALPVQLFRAGFTPPNVLNFFGITNPGAGAVLLLALGIAALGVAALLTLPERPVAPACAILGVALLLGVHALAYRNDGADAGAVRFLESVWLAPPGASLRFWPSAPN